MAPQVNAYTLLKRLPRSAQLIVLEPIEQARKKIGIKGQWLRVKTISGSVGFVAAWYVTPAQQPALGVETTEKSAKPHGYDELVLQTTTEGVALRTEPRIAAETLIKRMPYASELLADEAEENKVSLYGQWIRVRDIEEDQGFVAAWYVVRI
jgi:hypothetical protein